MKKLSHIGSRCMFNSKGDNFTDDHFKTSFARTRYINLRHLSGFIIAMKTQDRLKKQNIKKKKTTTKNKTKKTTTKNKTKKQQQQNNKLTLAHAQY